MCGLQISDVHITDMQIIDVQMYLNRNF